ncbi:hypothetical protein [Methanolapillus millepedarum]|uniref:Uncharacterized protein n=1 Tax=Methanolapillus millepedarum TaxID=3028296 RepID=A0AA96ZU73_9EURY|nr:hypothetical protein MsAc7_09350 [Methanosarcinaceae archaeon Ac7]
MFERFIPAIALNFYYLGTFLVAILTGTICTLSLLLTTAAVINFSITLGLENDYWTIVLKNIAGFSSVVLLIFFTGTGVVFVTKDIYLDLKKDDMRDKWKNKSFKKRIESGK